MRALLIFDNVTFGQGSEEVIRVAKGQTFGIELTGMDEGEQVRWATIGDSITDLNEMANGKAAEVKTTAVGMGEIQVQTPERGLRFWIALDVYDPNTTVTLGATASQPRQRPSGSESE